MRYPGAAAVLLAGLALAGCEIEETPPYEPTTAQVEADQAHKRNVRTIDSYCRRRPKPRGVGDPTESRPPTRREAIAALRGLAKELADAGDSYDLEYEPRMMLADLATRFESEHCLSDMTPRIDAYLRRVPLPEPTYAAEEYEYEEPDDTYQYGR